MLYTSYFTSVCTELFLFILNIIHNIPLYSLIKSSWHFFIILSGEKMSSNLSHGACLYLHNWSSWVHVFCMSICFTVCFYIDLWFTVWLDYFIREYMLIILLHYTCQCAYQFTVMQSFSNRFLSLWYEFGSKDQQELIHRLSFVFFCICVYFVVNCVPHCIHHV